MADTRQVLPVVTDDDYKELNPAPAVPSSEGTYPGGQLSPNPKMSPDVKEDGVRATEKSENQAPKTRPQVFKDVLVESLKSLGKIQVQSANDLVDKDGNPIVSGESGGGSTPLEVLDILNIPSQQVENLEVGDVVVSIETPDKYGFVVSYIEIETQKVLTHVTNNDVINIIYLWDTDSEQWVFDEQQNYQILGYDEQLFANTYFNYDGDANETKISFPKGVAPMTLYLESTGMTYLFDYKSFQVYDDSGTVAGNIDYDEENRPTITLEGEFSHYPDDDDITYCKYDRSIAGLNFYILYKLNKIPTKLYRHDVTLADSNNNTVCSVEIISSIEHTYSSTNFLLNRDSVVCAKITDGADCYGFVYDIMIDGTSNSYIDGIIYDPQLGTTSIYAWYDNLGTQPIKIIADSVTEIPNEYV